MKKSIVIILSVLVGIGIVTAAPVDPKLAKSVAQTFMRQQNPATADKLIWSEAQYPAGLQEMFLFTCKPEGFVLVAADDVAMPILGYSVNGTFDNKNVPEHVTHWLNDYAAEIGYLKANNIAQGDIAAAEWQALQRGDNFPQYSAGSVSPLLTTQWSQNPYYNNLCPYDNTYRAKSVTGCVATAMAQVMKYWNHPTVGNGSHSYSLSGFGTISANFGATTYDWANMPNSLSNSSSSQQINAVATLMFHCGVSVEMSYSANASGAQVYMPRRGYAAVNWAWLDYFDYSSDLRGVYQNQYTPTQWIQMLKDELDASRPVLYAGFDSESGHAFVCDGYNSNNRFHFNWGWGGYYDGYFAIGALNPGGGGTGSNSTYTFNLDNLALINVHPNNTLRVSPNSLTFAKNGGSQSVQIMTSQNSASWSATSNQSWVTTSPSTGNGSGSTSTLTITAAANNTGSNRTATVTIRQGNLQSTISVVQYGCSDDEKCVLKIAMNDSYNDGWDGASLTMTDASGFIYATVAATASSTTQYQNVSVCQGNVILKWNSGNYDNECSFTVYDADGNQKLRQSGAFSGNKTITDPCATSSGYHINATVNNSAMGGVAGTGTFPAGTIDTIMAIANDGYRFVGWDVDSLNPFILNVTENRTFAATFATLGVDTLHYDNGVPLTSLGSGSNDTLFWGIRLRAEDLGSHNTIKAVRLPDFAQGTHVIRIYEGGDNAPGNLIASKQVTFTNANAWRTVSFDSPVPINNSTSLWIIVGHKGDSPAGASLFAGTTAGSWYSLGGDTWRSITLEGYFITWMVQGIFGSACNISQLPYSQDFEEGMRCWTYTSAVTGSNNERYFGRNRNSELSHNSTYSFAFSSYYTATNYNQYLISPELTFNGASQMSFYYYAPYGNYKAESFRVLYSTTDDRLSSFTHQVRNVSAAGSSWEQFSATIPAEAKYVAINYYSVDKYFLYVDDIEFYVPDNPVNDYCTVVAPWTETFTSLSTTIGCWTAYDVDGDGYSWRISPNATMGMDDDGFASSASYVNNYGPLHPDNWIVSPAVVVPDSGTFKLSWAASGYGYDYEEHYSVYLSTSPDEFDDEAPIFEETITQIGYVTHSVSLADYAGDTIYIAFRHHNCTNQYMLFLDNVAVTLAGNDPDPDPNPDPDPSDCTVSLPWTETFSSTSRTADCWRFFDVDDDGFTWAIDKDVTYGYNDNGVAASQSYMNNYGPLTPNNWIVSPAVTLPHGSNYTLSWAAAAVDASDFRETYSVYASTNPTDSFYTLFTETLSRQGYVTHSVNITAFAGKTIYIAFRHHSCTNQFILLIDDVTVKAGSTPNGIDAASDIIAQVYPNPTNGNITIETNELQRVDIFDQMGRQLMSATTSKINLSALPRGTYTLRITTHQGVAIKKILKQ